MLQIKNISKSYPLGRENIEKVLQNISVDIYAGEFLAIYGPSGCGKSTLLNIIGGLDQNYQGDVLYQEENIRKFSEKEISRYRKENIGFVFQNFNLISHVSVLENLLIPLRLNKDFKQAEKIAMQLLAEVEMSEFALKKPTQLSGGQKQRVAIARALVNNPSVIIADEPTGALDSESQIIVLKTLRNLANQGKTVIVVTHNDEVATYADRIIKLKDGNIVEVIENCAIEEKKVEVERKKYNFSFLKALKHAFLNFMQRKYRNLLVSLGTAIGLTGILLSLGLGSGITNRIQEDFNAGNIPTQIQIMPNANKKGSSIINKDDIKELENYIGVDKIKYLEAPFSFGINSFIIDGYTLITPEAFPTYSQLKSHFSEMKIKVASNTQKEVAAGNLLTNTNEEGITITTQMIDDLNAVNQTKYGAQDLIGKSIELKLLQSTPDGNKEGVYRSKIVRVIKSEKQIAEENTFASLTEMEKIAQENGFQKQVNLLVLQLENPNENKAVMDKVNETNKYAAVSSKGLLEVVLMFIKIIQGLLAFMSLQAVVVSIVMIGIVLYISVVERTREIGVLKAVGYRNFFVAQIFLGESFIINLIANIFSIVFALGVGWLINCGVSYFIKEIGSIYEMQIQTVVMVFTISTVLTLIAAIIPSRKAMKLDPAASLRYE